MINIRVIANAKQNKVSKEGDRLKVHVNAQAQDGKANKAVIKLLADYFSVKKKDVIIAKGEKSRDKIVKINQK